MNIEQSLRSSCELHRQDKQIMQVHVGLKTIKNFKSLKSQPLSKFFFLWTWKGGNWAWARHYSNNRVIVKFINLNSSLYFLGFFNDDGQGRVEMLSVLIK